ncbi:hypothetical protein ACHAWF_007525 [Thalassiosira exigua]
MKDNLPSLTAATVAFASALRWLEGHELGIFQADLLRNLDRRFLPLLPWLLIRACLAREWTTRAFLALVERAFGRAEVLEGVWRRKVYMERQVRTFLERQRGNRVRVVILAAGYDLLAYQLASQYPDVTFIEIDHPATGAAKLSALKKLEKQRRGDEALPRNLKFCHDEIGKGISTKQALDNNGIKLDSSIIPTAVVMEGLTFYLTRDENEAIFRELSALFGCEGSIVAFDFFFLDEYCRPSNPNVKKVGPWLASFMKYKVKLFGEPFKWGIEPERLPSFFEGSGWELIPSRETFDGYGRNHPEFAMMMGIEYEATVRWVR